MMKTLNTELPGPTVQCPICHAYFVSKRGLSVHRATSAHCKDIAFCEMMTKKEGLVQIETDSTLFDLAKRRRVELYEDKHKRVWAPMWFIQILKKHSTIRKLGEDEYERKLTKEGRRDIAQTKKDRRRQSALTMMYKVEDAKGDYLVPYWVHDLQFWVISTGSKSGESRDAPE
jgi:hypothetical protein